MNGRRFALLFVLLACALQAFGADVHVAGPSPVADDVARQLQQRLTGVSVARDDADARVVVAVGAAAFRLETAARKDTVPVIGVALTRHAWRQIPAGKHTAVFWDPDPVRQLRLVRALMPGAKRVGVMSGSADDVLGDGLQREAKRLGMEIVRSEPVQRATLVRQLNKVLAGSDVLLGIDDPAVFSPETGKTVLLTSYRHGKPVIGPSAAWVEAGSVASLASRLPDAVATLSEWIPPLLAGGEIPAPQYPRTYGVATNASVARSMQMSLPSALSLEALASEREEPRP